jgi:hypothetical protein
VEDLERAAAALLIPGCGLLVAGTGLLLKAEPSSDAIAELFLGHSILFASRAFRSWPGPWSSTPAGAPSGFPHRR